MILANPGAGIVYGGMEYAVGAKVIGTNNSAYHGLAGTILEIRDGKSKKTDQALPELYCSFSPPAHPYEIQMLEHTFAFRTGQAATINDIPMKNVLQDPDMVKPVSGIEAQQTNIPIYILREDWSLDCEEGVTSWIFTDYAAARRKLNEKLAEEMESGMISQWADDESFMTEYDKDTYDGWLDGEYMSNHYKLSIEEDALPLLPGTVGDIWRIHQNRGRFEDFESEVEQWDDLADLTEEEYQQFISDTRIPGLIDNKLGETYWEAYWNAVSKAGRELLCEYQKKKAEQELYEGGVRNDD